MQYEVCDVCRYPIEVEHGRFVIHYVLGLQCAGSDEEVKEEEWNPTRSDTDRR